MTQPTAAPALDARLVPTDRIFVVSNPRKRFPPLDELRESIAKHGILSPLRVHDAGAKGFRLIFGECRLRCALELKLPEVPVVVVTATEEQILEEQLIENGQRRDIHPAEEAEAYAELKGKYGRSIEEIALRVGKSRTHVLTRLKLCDLVDEARAAFYADKLSTKVAYLLARIPNPELQRQALGDLSRPRFGAPWTDTDFEHHVRERYMLRLDQAPFDRRDGTLVPQAGPCGACAKRTGNARDLFDDVREKDVCTDLACFEAKVKATWTRQCEQALARGWEVLDEEHSLKLFPHGSYVARDAPYIELDSVHLADPKGRTWRQLLGKSSVQVVLAKDTFHKTHHLVAKEQAEAAVVEAGYSFSSKLAQSGSRQSEDERERRKKLAVRAAVTRAAISAVAEAATKKTADEAFWRLVLGGLCDGSWQDVIREVVKRRGLSAKDSRPEEVLRKAMDGMNVAELRGLAVELTVARGAFWTNASDYAPRLKKACELYGVDLQDLARSVRSEREQPEAAKSAA